MNELEVKNQISLLNIQTLEFRSMDDVSEAEAFMGLQGLMASVFPPDFTQLEEEHSDVIRSLTAFDRLETLALVAGLLTVPQFHANTIRVELLQNFVHRNAAGKNKATRNRIGQWLNQGVGRGWAARQEDPVEDVFISNVVSNVGNSRIFEGVWESNDFWLQEALNALRTFRGEPWADQLLEQCFAILKLSESLAERCGLSRYCMGGGDVRTNLVLPAQAELYSRAALVRFSRYDLDGFGVRVELLAPFIHDETPSMGAVGKSTLERHPLVPDGDGVLIAIPPAISPAIRLHIVEALFRLGLVEKFERVLFSQQLSELFNEGVRALGGKIVEQPGLPSLPQGTPATAQEMVEFDRGKFAHVLFFEDSMMEFLKTGLGGAMDLPDEKWAPLYLHCQRLAEHAAMDPDYSGGLTIAVAGGLGRGSSFGAKELPNGWYLTGFGLPDFLALGRVRDTDLLRIWKLNEQMSELQARSIRITNINGEMNLLGYWQSNGERLVPRDAPASGGGLIVGTDFLANVRQDLRTRHDLHAVERRNPNIWVPVRRYNPNPFFKELELDPIYGDENDAARGRLRGVVETSRHAWWVSSLQRYSIGPHRNIQFRIWDAILQWMARIAPIAEATLPALRRGPTEVFLRFERLETWTTESIEDLPEPEDPNFRFNRRFGAVQISLPLGFLRYFSTPQNIAERKIIRACFEGIAALGGVTLDRDTLDGLVQRVVCGDNARFFHLAFAQDYRQRVGSGDLKPRFVSEGEGNFECVGLAQRILGRNDSNPVEGTSLCNQFLQAVVDECWKVIRASLEKLNRSSVIVRALQNVEVIECDTRQWAMTSSALLAIHQNREDVVDVAYRREKDWAKAKLASRIVVEMAVCNCLPAGGVVLSEAEFDRVLALVCVLLYSANSSDAVQYGLTPAKVQFYPNGEFFVDEAYSETVLQPYMAEHFSQQFAASAAHYSDYYRDPRASPVDGNAGEFDPVFVDAFHAEYGITPDDLISAQVAIEKDSSRDERLVVQRTQAQIREVLASSGLSADVANRIFEHFSLCPRDTWDKTPDGFTSKDWYPWRYRRRLSVLARPFIRLERSEDAPILFAPGIVRDSVELLFGRLLNGRLPAEDFHSSQMRSWIGEATRLRGDAFEQRVAEELRAIGLNALVGRSMSEFGADVSYGDLDVLAWPPTATVFYLIECKRLRFARTVAEVGEQLREFKGDEMDRLARHVRRCQWLEQHHDELCRVTRTNPTGIQLIPLLVTSTVVPMQFSKDLPLPAECIVSLSRLQAWMKARA